jgi:hypothetical protein
VTVVHYKQWRDHEWHRIQTNDTVMGLLAGSKLAAQTLSLTAGSKLVLSQIFPQVEHIRRFNLPVDRARAVLEDAEQSLGILAVPQIFALHEDLLKGMGRLLEGEGLLTADRVQGMKTVNIHERLASAVPPHQFTQEVLELFHLVRETRNTHIHNGGRADNRLIASLGGVSARAFMLWEETTGEAFPRYSVGDSVGMGLSELIGILAITQRLAEEANVMLQAALPRSRWADMLVKDWAPTKKPGNPKQWIRALLGLARTNYGPVQLTDVDIKAALAREGM